MFDKQLYIAPKIGDEIDDYGNEKPYFGIPEEYHFLYMPTSGQVDYQIYGAKISSMFTAYVNIKYLGKIHSLDRAYLIDEETQNVEMLATNDTKYCNKANYFVKSVLPQNLKLKITFEKIE